MTTYTPDPTIDRLVTWGAARDNVRAMLLTSTRAVPGATVDALSDYDVILILRDVAPLATDRRWVEDFGRVLVAYWDPLDVEPVTGLPSSGNVIQYADGLKIDFTLRPAAHLAALVQRPALPAELDAGYRVLLDKDGVASRLRPPTYRGYLPTKPDAAAFATHVNDFLSDVPYVAKCLLRDELLPAKWCLDYDMKHVYLRPLLEWKIGCDHDWSVGVGSLGKGLRKHLPADTWAELEACYAGAGIADNWDALYRTVALFGKVAREVAACLGYAYPADLEREVMAFTRRMQAPRSVHLQGFPDRHKACPYEEPV